MLLIMADIIESNEIPCALEMKFHLLKAGSSRFPLIEIRPLVNENLKVGHLGIYIIILEKIVVCLLGRF